MKKNNKKNKRGVHKSKCGELDTKERNLGKK